MKDLIQIHYDNADRPTVSGRELWEALEVETPYTQWFKRMSEYGFSENWYHKNVKPIIRRIRTQPKPTTS